MGKAKIVAAQVILRRASGKARDPHTAITSENIREFLPSQEDIKVAREAFAEAGFEVGNVVANSFSISGALSTFDRTFKTRAADATASELPLGGLSEELARVVEAVTFTPPPDFGPTKY